MHVIHGMPARWGKLPATRILADRHGIGDGALVVRDSHVEEGLAELLVAGGALTQSLLGAARPKASKQ